MPSTQFNRKILSVSPLHEMKRHGTFRLGLKLISNKYSNRSRCQYFPLSVVPYIDFARCTGQPQYFAYSGNRMPNIFGIVMNILLLVLAWRKAPIKSSCFTLTLSLQAWAKNIFNAWNDAGGDHLSSESVFPAGLHLPQNVLHKCLSFNKGFQLLTSRLEPFPSDWSFWNVDKVPYFSTSARICKGNVFASLSPLNCMSNIEVPSKRIMEAGGTM